MLLQNKTKCTVFFLLNKTIYTKQNETLTTSDLSHTAVQQQTVLPSSISLSTPTIVFLLLLGFTVCISYFVSGLDPVVQTKTKTINDDQDINQDGYGDIVVGAPGAGSDSGSACVVFGGATFSEASYTLGDIGAEGSYSLIGPSDDGYGGFSVAGAGV